MMQNQSAENNARHSAFDLARRMVDLYEAAQTLKLPYTYDIFPAEHPKKELRKQLGKSNAEILDALTDQFMDAVVVRWLLYRGIDIEKLTGEGFRAPEDGSNYAQKELIEHPNGVEKEEAAVESIRNISKSSQVMERILSEDKREDAPGKRVHHFPVR